MVVSVPLIGMIVIGMIVIGMIVVRMRFVSNPAVWSDGRIGLSHGLVASDKQSGRKHQQPSIRLHWFPFQLN